MDTLAVWLRRLVRQNQDRNPEEDAQQTSTSADQLEDLQSQIVSRNSEPLPVPPIRHRSVSLSTHPNTIGQPPSPARRIAAASRRRSSIQTTDRSTVLLSSTPTNPSSGAATNPLAYSPASEASIRSATPFVPIPTNAEIKPNEQKGGKRAIPLIYDDVRRLCMPSLTCSDTRTADASTADVKVMRFVDAWGRQEARIVSIKHVNSFTNFLFGSEDLFRSDSAASSRLGGTTSCCGLPQSYGCCHLCEPNEWIFQGSQYNPHITLLYAHMDGCIPSSVKLIDPKFIIPWRYRNRKTGAISWKVIHMCGPENIKDAESETIVINIMRDEGLRRVIDTVKRETVDLVDVDLVEYILSIVRESLGDYGLPGGATSTQADASLFNQLQQQGHNFMMLCSVKIGLCRHKALLFKILSDAVNLDCALVTGYSTGGRHQWNVVTLTTGESFVIDPTSPHFTWSKQGSMRTKAYRISADTSFGHAGITLKMQGIL